MTLAQDNSVLLRSGRKMPLLGFGTYQIPSTPEGESVVAEAISSGYRLLDCASFYKNEGSIGEVVKEIP